MRPASHPLRPLAAVCLSSLVACTTYPERTGEALGAFRAGDFARSEALFADEDVTGSPFLSGVEAGTAALTAGAWEEAREQFDRAAEVTAELEERALLGAEELGEALGSWALNDTARAYEGEGFERVYLHVCLGLCYLALGDVQGARVEARRANRLLEREEELYETEYRAGGLGHFLSAVAYELEGAWDEAYIDYLRMEEKGLGTELAGTALARLAELLGRDEERAEWVELYGEPPPFDLADARVVLFAGVGLGPVKVEDRLWIPLHEGSFAMAAAQFSPRPQTVSGLVLSDDTGGRATSVVVEDVAEVSRRNLSDRLGWQVLRSAARGVLKRELTRELEREHGTAGRLAGELFTIFSERADLRSWLTLPDSWQVLRLDVPPGTRSLHLQALGGESVDLGRYALEPGETLFVLARSLGPRVYAHVIGGGVVDAPPPEETPFPETTP